MNDFANGRTAASSPAVVGNPRLASYNAFKTSEGSLQPPNPAATITTKAAVGASTCTFTPRPFGSGGITQLVQELDAAAADGGRRSCIDFARSSTGHSGAGAALHWVPFAVDGLTYTTRNDSQIPTNLSVAQLQQAYLCNISGVLPLLPQPGSGTRSAWLGFINVTEAQIAERRAAPGTTQVSGNPDAPVQRCIADNVVAPNGVVTDTPLTESVGNVAVNAANVIPYSIGQLRAQQSGAIRNDSGITQGRRVNGIIPDVDDVAFPFRRLVYNVIPTQFVGNADYIASFGPGSSLCTTPAVLRVNGFAPITAGDPLLAATGTSGCGDLTTVTLRGRTAGTTGPPSP